MTRLAAKVVRVTGGHDSLQGKIAAPVLETIFQKLCFSHCGGPCMNQQRQVWTTYKAASEAASTLPHLA